MAKRFTLPLLLQVVKQPSAVPVASASSSTIRVKLFFISNLKVDGISAHEGVFRVDLSGTVRLGGVCDNPRFKAQIKETIMQFPTVRQANVFINGTPLEKILSGAGG